MDPNRTWEIRRTPNTTFILISICLALAVIVGDLVTLFDQPKSEDPSHTFENKGYIEE